MQVLKIVRKFNYNGIALVDPNPALSIDAVREFYATQYPELNNAVIEGPATKGQEATYKFLRAVGDKGSNNQGATLRGQVRDLAAGKGSPAVKAIEHQRCHFEASRPPNQDALTGVRNLGLIVGV